MRSEAILKRGNSGLLSMYIKKNNEERKLNDNYYKCFKAEHVLTHLPQEKRRFTALEFENCVKID